MEMGLPAAGGGVAGVAPPSAALALCSAALAPSCWLAPLRSIPFRGMPLRGNPLRGNPFNGSSAYAEIAPKSTKLQYATATEALRVALRNLTDRRVVRRGCVAMMCSFGRVSLYVCLV